MPGASMTGIEIRLPCRFLSRRSSARDATVPILNGIRAGARARRARRARLRDRIADRRPPRSRARWRRRRHAARSTPRRQTLRFDDVAGGVARVQDRALAAVERIASDDRGLGAQREKHRLLDRVASARAGSRRRGRSTSACSSPPASSADFASSPRPDRNAGSGKAIEERGIGHDVPRLADRADLVLDAVDVEPALPAERGVELREQRRRAPPARGRRGGTSRRRSPRRRARSRRRAAMRSEPGRGPARRAPSTARAAAATVLQRLRRLESTTGSRAAGSGRAAKPASARARAPPRRASSTTRQPVSATAVERDLRERSEEDLRRSSGSRTA